jgi:NAD+--asparagine ADP-ribosyltransferase
LDENWKLFENNTSNVEEDIIKMSKERFHKKYQMPPIPELATKAWLERLIYPIGINNNNEFNPLNEELENKIDDKTMNAIKNLDNAIEKALIKKIRSNQRKEE